jgi:phosphoenolpyruvate carboxylase
VEIFGFHLATLDMRQSSDVHERVLAELFAKAQVEADYAGLAKSARSRCCWANCPAAPAVFALPHYSDETERAGHPARGARDPRRYGARHPQLHHLAHRDRVRPAGSAAAAEGNGLLRIEGNQLHELELMVIPLFETIPDLRNAAGIMRGWLTLPQVKG